MTIAYLRVSTGKQHLENQKEEIEKFAARKNLTINRWVTEVVSGKKKENDRKLGRLLKSLKKGDILIVTELSRLSRTLLDIMSILHRCLEMNITVYSTKDGYAFDNSINSKVLAFAFALVAEIEHNLISMRTKEALAHRKSVWGARQEKGNKTCCWITEKRLVICLKRECPCRLSVEFIMYREKLFMP